jgi:hypothetical protein
MSQEKPLSWFTRFITQVRRLADREHSLPLVAYFWDGGVPRAHSIRDLSSTGLYMLTDQRWYPGTLVTLILQRTMAADADPHRAITLKARVVWSGKDGVGLAFVVPRSEGVRVQRNSQEADMKTLYHFIRLLQAEKSYSDDTQAAA